LDDLLDLPNGQFQDQTNRLFILAVLLDYLLEKPFSLLAIFPGLNRSIARDARIFFDDPKTDNFIAIVN
jgi:hypothetical protein